MSLTPDETAALRRLLERLRTEQPLKRRVNLNALGTITTVYDISARKPGFWYFEQIPTARDADLLVPIVKRLLNE